MTTNLSKLKKSELVALADQLARSHNSMLSKAFHLQRCIPRMSKEAAGKGGKFAIGYRYACETIRRRIGKNLINHKTFILVSK